MAKKSSVQKNDLRQTLIKKFRSKRNQLKKQV